MSIDRRSCLSTAAPVALLVAIQAVWPNTAQATGSNALVHVQDTVAEATASRHYLYWIAERAGRKIYLVPEEHNTPIDESMFSRHLSASIQSADAHVYEGRLGQSGQEGMSLSMKDGLTISAIVGPERYRALFARLMETDAQLPDWLRRSAGLWERMNPMWVGEAWLGIAAWQPSSGGLSTFDQRGRQNSAQRLISRLVPSSATRHSVDTRAAYDSVWASCMSGDEVASFLDAAIDSGRARRASPSGATNRRLAALIAAGEDVAIARYFDGSRQDMYQQTLFQCGIDPRAKAWMSELLATAETHRNVVFSFGLAHAFGDSGLLALLGRHGFHVVKGT